MPSSGQASGWKVHRDWNGLAMRVVPYLPHSVEERVGHLDADAVHLTATRLRFVDDLPFQGQATNCRGATSRSAGTSTLQRSTA